MKTITSQELAPHEVWSAVVVYEDLATRERAMVACDHLVNQFWPEIEFKFHWWRTDFLEDDGMAATAEENATDADFVIYCGSPDKELSLKTRNWFESWISHRKGREVALLDLTPKGPGVNGHTHEKRNFLRKLTQPTSIAYLTEGIAKAARRNGDLNPVTQRAVQISSALDSVFQQANSNSRGMAFATAQP